MTFLRILASRIRALLHLRRLDAELDQEIQSHLYLLEQEYLAQGMNAADARYAARRSFGAASQMKEAYRDQRGMRPLEILWQDLRYSIRTLIHSPGFTIVAILTLALGIGVNTAIFSAVNAVVLRALPYPDADRLVSLWETESSRRTSVSAANLIDYQRQNHVFTAIAAYDLAGENLTGAGPSQNVWVELANTNLLSLLGVQPERGRVFRPEEDRPGNEHVAIISDEFWRRQFGSDPAILSRTLQLNAESFRIVGILPPKLQLPSQFGLSDRIAVYVPIAFPADLLAAHGDHDFNAIARLKPGITLPQAQSDLDRISASLARTYRDDRHTGARIAFLRDDIARNVRTSMLVLLATVGLVWLVACVNVANLLLARAVGRQREIAVRVALGASRTRVVLSLVVFSLLLAVTGCVCGLVLGLGIQQLLVKLAPADIPRLDSVRFDIRVFAVMSILSLLSGVLFGLFPAWQVSKAKPSESLKTSERGVVGASVMRWRSVLMIAEIALSLVLLVGGGLLLKSFILLNGVDLGFQPEHVLAANINLHPARYSGQDRRVAFFEQLEKRLTALPGVQAVGFANRFPLRGGWSGGLEIDSLGPGLEADMQAVNPGYFSTLGISLLRGRSLTPMDRKGTPPVALVNAAFVRKFLPGQDPLKHRFRRNAQSLWISIIGVVADIRRNGKTAPMNPEVYYPAAQTELYPVILADLAVRTQGDPRRLAAAIQKELWAIDKDLPLTHVQTLDEVLSESMSHRRFQTLLVVLFAAVALALALIGIYGVISYSVAQRTAELGIRIALGAGRGNILRLILRQAALVIALGISSGLTGAYALSRYLSSSLFAIKPSDPGTYICVALLLAAVALLACFAPARHAAGVDPVIALRYE